MNLFDTNTFIVEKIELPQANDFVKKNHRHCAPVIGHIFSLGLWHNKKIVGVAICGLPRSRHYNKGIIEINRLCTDGTKNACSKLYAACCKYAKILGFFKAITYTLKSENGASLKASNFTIESERAGGMKWTGKRKHISTEFKKRWAYQLKTA